MLHRHEFLAFQGRSPDRIGQPERR